MVFVIHMQNDIRSDGIHFMVSEMQELFMKLV